MRFSHCQIYLTQEPYRQSMLMSNIFDINENKQVSQFVRWVLVRRKSAPPTLDQEDRRQNHRRRHSHAQRDLFPSQPPSQQHRHNRIDVRMRGNEGGRVAFQKPVIGGEGYDGAEDDEVGERPQRTRGDGGVRDTAPFSEEGAGKEQHGSAGYERHGGEQDGISGEMGAARIDNADGPRNGSEQHGDGGEQYAGGGAQGFSLEQEADADEAENRSEERRVGK